MRARTREEIGLCPHMQPFEEITASWEYGRRGEMGYAIKGCRLCGGIGKIFFMHLNRGKSRPVAEMNRLNAEDADRVQAAIKAWREALPEPGEETSAANPVLPTVAGAPAPAPGQ